MLCKGTKTKEMDYPTQIKESVSRTTEDTLGFDSLKPTIFVKDFEEILEVVGSQGIFQKRLLYGILWPMMALCPFLTYGIVFILDIPDHWCHVPGRNESGSSFTMEEWKNMTIPW